MSIDIMLIWIMIAKVSAMKLLYEHLNIELIIFDKEKTDWKWDRWYIYKACWLIVLYFFVWMAQQVVTMVTLESFILEKHSSYFRSKKALNDEMT